MATVIVPGVPMSTGVSTVMFATVTRARSQ